MPMNVCMLLELWPFNIVTAVYCFFLYIFVFPFHLLSSHLGALFYFVLWPVVSLLGL